VKKYYNLKYLYLFTYTHDPSEIILICWFWCSGNIIINFENSFVAA